MIPHAWAAISILPVAILCTLNLRVGLHAQTTGSGVVSHVESLYHQGKFRDAELTALRALQEPTGLAAMDVGLIHKMLGFTYVAMGENEKARDQFTEWLTIDPKAKLDSVYVSPKIIDVFKEARESLKKRREPTRDYSELKVQLTAVKRSLIFPGLGQLYTDKPAKGVTMFASEILLIGAFAYCQVQYLNARDDYLQERNPANMQSAYDRYNNFNRARYGTLALAAGIYLYSLADALFVPPPKANPRPLSLSVSPGTERPLTITFRY
jgi:tetratricopeptide (TPR) repeat protein